MIFFVILFYVAISTLIYEERLHYAIPLYYLILGLLTFIVYAKDKRAAIDNNWRISEKTLHILSLIGGWTGAILAQKILRHKTQKRNFYFVFLLSIVIHVYILYAVSR